MTKNNLKEKSFLFSICIVHLHQKLCTEKHEYVLSKQVLRSGTNPGAMIREAEHAQSKADFIHKLSIAQKEINETLYWLDLLFATKYLEKQEHEKLKSNATEILKMLTSSIKTSKNNLYNKTLSN